VEVAAHVFRAAGLLRVRLKFILHIADLLAQEIRGHGFGRIEKSGQCGVYDFYAGCGCRRFRSAL
jgi:hypothetical protein